jgi:hypothetical protein
VKTRSSTLILAVFAVLALGSVIIFQWRSHQLRFDGTYQAYDQQSGVGDHYYRFYLDGTVLSHTGYPTAQDEAKYIYRGSKYIYHGRYSLKRGKISITVEGYDGATIPIEADEVAREAFERASHTKTYHLLGEVRSGRIEFTSADEDGHREYRFVKVRFPNEA